MNQPHCRIWNLTSYIDLQFDIKITQNLWTRFCKIVDSYNFDNKKIEIQWNT